MWVENLDEHGNEYAPEEYERRVAEAGANADSMIRWIEEDMPAEETDLSAPALP